MRMLMVIKSSEDLQNFKNKAATVIHEMNLGLTNKALAISHTFGEIDSEYNKIGGLCIIKINDNLVTKAYKAYNISGTNDFVYELQPEQLKEYKDLNLSGIELGASPPLIENKTVPIAKKINIQEWLQYIENKKVEEPKASFSLSDKETVVLQYIDTTVLVDYHGSQKYMLVEKVTD